MTRLQSGVCISSGGIPKRPLPEAEVGVDGIRGDHHAHAQQDPALGHQPHGAQLDGQDQQAGQQQHDEGPTRRQALEQGLDLPDDRQPREQRKGPPQRLPAPFLEEDEEGEDDPEDPAQRREQQFQHGRILPPLAGRGEGQRASRPEKQKSASGDDPGADFKTPACGRQRFSAGDGGS